MTFNEFITGLIVGGCATTYYPAGSSAQFCNYCYRDVNNRFTRDGHNESCLWIKVLDMYERILAEQINVIRWSPAELTPYGLAV